MEDIKDAELKLQCLSLLLVATGQENVSELVSDEQHCHGESCRGNKCNAFMYLYFGYLIWKIMLANHVYVYLFVYLFTYILPGLLKSMGTSGSCAVN